MLQNKKMKSIFRLEAVRCYDSDEHQYRDASTSILGYSLYTSLRGSPEGALRPQAGVKPL